jgi:hypothetical protein
MIYSRRRRVSALAMGHLQVLTIVLKMTHCHVVFMNISYLRQIIIVLLTYPPIPNCLNTTGMMHVKVDTRFGSGFENYFVK